MSPYAPVTSFDRLSLLRVGCAQYYRARVAVRKEVRNDDQCLAAVLVRVARASDVSSLLSDRYECGRRPVCAQGLIEVALGRSRSINSSRAKRRKSRSALSAASCVSSSVPPLRAWAARWVVFGQHAQNRRHVGVLGGVAGVAFVVKWGRVQRELPYLCPYGRRAVR